MNQHFLPMRRKVLLGIGAGIGALALPALALSLDGATVAARSVAPAAGPAFMAVSRRLTERTTLSPITAARLEAALVAQDPSFSSSVEALAKLLEDRPQAPASELFAAGSSLPAGVSATATSILAGWYLGAAGTAPDAPVIAYHDALMFDPVRDVVAPPSYCREAPGYWTARPPAA